MNFGMTRRKQHDWNNDNPVGSLFDAAGYSPGNIRLHKLQKASLYLILGRCLAHHIGKLQQLLVPFGVPASMPN
ncbi:hypothetical protein PUR_19720 [Paenibacillus sp. URB8-2]|nr:hypothetical protein PUR_19720 [Paenibacillus sp. URB8-2]